jgi:putative nucleotidyltransferase with HDIG domain
MDKKKTDYIELMTRVTNKFLTQIDREYSSSVELLSRILDRRDSYTHNHSKNVSKLAVSIAEKLGLPAKEKNKVKYASLLHDIGKMGIDMSILKKKGKLTKSEWKEIRVHTRIGAEIVGKIRFLSDLVPTVLHHHERFSGGGYPYPELKNEDIPLTARIVTCTDAFDAMTSDRAYRKALSKEKALEELRSCSGTQFDPDVVSVLIKIVG